MQTKSRSEQYWQKHSLEIYLCILATCRPFLSCFHMLKNLHHDLRTIDAITTEFMFEPYLKCYFTVDPWTLKIGSYSNLWKSSETFLMMYQRRMIISHSDLGGSAVNLQDKPKKSSFWTLSCLMLIWTFLS